MPRCDSGAPDIVMTPIAPMLNAGAKNVVVPPWTSRMCSLSFPLWIRVRTDFGSGRYLMTPEGVFFVSKLLYPSAINVMTLPPFFFAAGLGFRPTAALLERRGVGPTIGEAARPSGERLARAPAGFRRAWTPGRWRG